MKTAKVFNFGIYAGDLIEDEKGTKYRFWYCDEMDAVRADIRQQVKKEKRLNFS